MIRQSIFFSLYLSFGSISIVRSQMIADFVSVIPSVQNSNFQFPSSHAFQKIIEHGDEITGGTIQDNFDFTAYVPVSGSSVSGQLSINHELSTGGVTVMQFQLNTAAELWQVSDISALDFSSVNGTAHNCSGGITPWGTVITCEETETTVDTNMDGYQDMGWHVEIHPVTRQVLGKRWAMGHGKKENVALHSNLRTTYFGNDANPGYLFRFVATSSSNLSTGVLSVYTGPKTGAGTWVTLANATPAECNTTMSQAAAAGATVFNGVEDVEIGPDGKIYFAVKNENQVYRFTDSNPLTGTTTTNMETYVGNASYTITHTGGSTVVPWGTGNDNLAFDGQGNLWVLQDGDNNYIWVVMNGHTQASPQVKVFGVSPAGSEPTGITFTPDYKYLFMSFQHPSSSNNVDYQEDAAGNLVAFDRDIAIVISLSANLGCAQAGQSCNDNNPATSNDTYTAFCVCQGIAVADTVSFSLASGNDDAEEASTSGSVTLQSTDLEMVFDGTVQQYVGLRFAGISVLHNALIEHAYLQFTTDEATTSSTQIIIHGEKQENALPYNSTSGYNISQREMTTDSVTWVISPWPTVGESGTAQRSPDLKGIIQEIVNQPGWQPGNALSFIISGSGSRVAESYEGGSSAAPRLEISYRSQNVNNVGISTDQPAAKLQVKDGDVYLETLMSGVILRSPDGNCWKLTVSNAGAVQAIQVVCPQ